LGRAKKMMKEGDALARKVNLKFCSFQSMGQRVQNSLDANLIQFKSK